MIIQVGVYLFMTLKESDHVTKSKTQHCESTSWQSPPRTVSVKKNPNNFYTVSSLHLCPLKLEVTHFSLFFSQTSRAPHIQPYHSQIQLASILGFNFLPEPWKYLTDFIFTTSSSLIKQGKITLIETTFD